MKIWSTSLLIGALLCGINSAQAAPLVFEGLDPAQKDLVIKQIPQAASSDPSLEVVDQTLRALMVTGDFERVIADRTDGQIKIIATPLRLIGTVQVEGNRIASDKDLKEIIRIEDGEKFDRKKVLKAGEDLKNYYGERGYFNTVIEVTFLKGEKNKLSVKFDVIENDPCEITTIEFISPNTILNERLLGRVRRSLRRPLTTANVDEIRSRVRNYFVDRQYMRSFISDPEIKYNAEKTKAEIKFTVTEPHAYQIFFTGNRYLSSAALYKLVRRDDFKQGQFEPKSELASIIRNHYLRLGFPNVEVKAQLNEVPAAFIRRLTFTIKEGPRVKIKAYEVSGRISRPDVYYSNFIKNHSSDIIRKGYYNREDLDLAYRNLITELRNQGFLRAKIQAARLEYLNAADEAKVVLTVDEGPLTQVSRIEFIGAKDFQEMELLEVLKIKNNAPLRLTDLEESIGLLKAFYLERGYLEMKILNETEDLVEYNDRGTQAIIRFKLFEGPRVVVKSITLEGNTFTKDYVLLNEIDIKPGDVLTPQKIDESIVRLNRLGIFSRVSIRTVEEGTTVSERTLLLSVAERDPGLLRFGAGLNSERNLTARGFTAMTYSNLFGTARSVSARVELQSNIADINYLEHRISAGYLEPFLFGSRTRGRVNVTRSDEVFRDSENDNGRIIQIVNSDRVDFSVERDLNRFNKFMFTVWSLDTQKESERNGKCIDATEGEKCPSETQQIAVVGPSLDIDYRDNSFLPTQGSFTHFGLEYSHPDLGSSDLIEFARFDAVFNYYMRLGSPKYVWANSFGGGYVTNLSEREGSGVPVKYAFFLGGSTTLRGYERNSKAERVPNDEEFPVTKAIDLVVPKDSHYFLFKSEFRWSIVGDHGAVLFYDGGLVKVTGFEFEDPYRQSVGVGYRYNTPVGPLRIDVGFKIDRRSIEREYRGHVAIGTF